MTTAEPGTASIEVLRYRAFADAPHGGNAAGVVLDARGLSDAQMLRIAADVGYSETAFVTDDAGSDGPLRVRYFSPEAEVPFCGHATVALAVAVAEAHGDGERTFATTAGDVRLTASREGDGVVVAFTSVEPQVRDLDADVLAALLDALGLRHADLDERYPAREAFAGNWHPILVLSDEELFHQFRFDPSVIRQLMNDQGWSGTITVLFARDERTFEARNLFPVARITEDPATGSAAAATGAYLRAIGMVPAVGAVPGSREITVFQGAHVGRPSRLNVVIPTEGGITVRGGARLIPGGD